MINLKLVQGNDGGMDAVRRRVKVMTTIVLVVYIVGVFGFLGWWKFVQRKESRSDDQLKFVSGQVASFAQSEVLIRKIESRVKGVKEFLSGRQGIGTTAKLLVDLGMPVAGWDYDLKKGKNSVRLVADGVDVLKNHVEELRKTYKRLKVEMLSWQSDLGWSVTVSLVGGGGV